MINYDNENRTRYYGLRKGDTVSCMGPNGKIITVAEVIGYGGDNNRVVVKKANGNTVDWVAEWCDIITKVEDK